MQVWSQNAGKALGIAASSPSPHDYIATLIAWRRDAVEAMCRHIEAVHGKHWVEVVASVRKFSECMMYGRYVDDVTGGAGHFHGSEEYCHVQWSGTPHSDEEITRLHRRDAAGAGGDRHAVLHRHGHRAACGGCSGV